MREQLFGKTLEELKSLCLELGLPSYTGRQLAEWLYKKDVLSIEEMTNLSKLPTTKRFQFFAPFIKITGAEGSPVRFFALLED